MRLSNIFKDDRTLNKFLRLTQHLEYNNQKLFMRYYDDGNEDDDVMRDDKTYRTKTRIFHL